MQEWEWHVAIDESRSSSKCFPELTVCCCPLGLEIAATDRKILLTMQPMLTLLSDYWVARRMNRVRIMRVLWIRQARSPQLNYAVPDDKAIILTKVPHARCSGCLTVLGLRS